MYRQVTAKYKNTLDKLEYLKALAPQLYEFCMHSLYAKAFYEGFDWLLELIRHHKSEPKPHPPVPEHCPPCSGLPTLAAHLNPVRPIPALRFSAVPDRVPPVGGPTDSAWETVRDVPTAGSRVQTILLTCACQTGARGIAAATLAAIQVSATDPGGDFDALPER